MHMAAKGRLKGDTRPSHETRRPPLGNDTGGLLKQFGRRKSQLARVDSKKFNPGHFSRPYRAQGDQLRPTPKRRDQSPPNFTGDQNSKKDRTEKSSRIMR
ncbi:unnamed protein product [Microthlaspi erraticum]|uniref:Uncharacterized protein n=1 Tax=Microthlaspi erraticum TaxID=1685480 RepID=A0A6D2KB17_9BRAS|nr:unnamed protein product [Microthlaspi erraticum]